jgi:Apea-like HEPN
MEPEDGVYTNLRILLEEFYPFIVQESSSEPFQITPLLYRQISEHECFSSLMVAIACDGSLAKFFPALPEKASDELDVDSIKDLQTIIVWSDGSSEGMTPLTLCAAILNDVFRYLWSWRDDPSLDDTLKRLPDSIELARNLAKKRTVKIPAVVSIHNIGLVRGRTIQIGHAILRKPIRYDRFRLVALALAQDANALVLRLETDFSAVHIRATSRDANRDEDQQKTQHLIETIGHKSMERQIRRLQDEVNRVCLAIVLASSPGKILSPVQGWNSAVNPLSDMNHSQRSSARSLNAPYPAQKIDKVTERRIARFASLIERHPNVLKAGIRRLLLAITERMYPEDGFVDAVICWENLFRRSPETTLRVCGSMAKLLSPANDDRRRNIYKELSKLYGLRNKIVHGSADNIPEEIYKSRDLAIKYAIDALKIIYIRDDLLEINDSYERGRMVLLGR